MEMKRRERRVNTSEPSDDVMLGFISWGLGLGISSCGGGQSR